VGQQAAAEPVAESTATQPEKQTPSTSRLASIAGTAGLLAVATYTVIVAAPLDDVTAPFVASLSGPLLAGASIALYFVLASERPTFAGQLGAIANVAAGVLVTAMFLVQLALKESEDKNAVSPAIEDVFDHVHFGLDLAWDVFISAGAILFACAMLGHPLFPRWIALSGVVIGATLYAINFTVFPEPPADAGLVDIGPLVGAWYAIVSVRTLRLRRALAE
jgi:hypothetical protein